MTMWRGSIAAIGRWRAASRGRRIFSTPIRASESLEPGRVASTTRAPSVFDATPEKHAEMMRRQRYVPALLHPTVLIRAAALRGRRLFGSLQDCRGLRTLRSDCSHMAARQYPGTTDRIHSQRERYDRAEAQAHTAFPAQGPDREFFLDRSTCLAWRRTHPRVSGRTLRLDCSGEATYMALAAPILAVTG